MNSKSKAPSRLMAEITELATAMHANGTMDPATFKKITRRQFGEVDVATFAPLSPDEVRAIRQQAHMSQAVFAKHLNLTVGYVSQLERGAKRPTGATLALLTVIQRKGIETVL